MENMHDFYKKSKSGHKSNNYVSLKQQKQSPVSIRKRLQETILMNKFDIFLFFLYTRDM